MKFKSHMPYVFISKIPLVVMWGLQHQHELRCRVHRQEILCDHHQLRVLFFQNLKEGHYLFAHFLWPNWLVLRCDQFQLPCLSRQPKIYFTCLHKGWSVFSWIGLYYFLQFNLFLTIWAMQAVRYPLPEPTSNAFIPSPSWSFSSSSAWACCNMYKMNYLDVAIFFIIQFSLSLFH